jgi:hypothetical protein
MTRPNGGPILPTPRVSPALAAVACLFAIALAACQPSVKVEAPDKPITINLNVKLDAEVRVKLEEQAEEDIEENPDIF